MSRLSVVSGAVLVLAVACSSSEATRSVGDAGAPSPEASASSSSGAGGADGGGLGDATASADTGVPTLADWPGPTNTGVPKDTVLTPYSGACSITIDGTVIDAKTISCDLEIHAKDVVIRRSLVHGIVILDTDLPASSGWSFRLEDSEVDAGTVQRSAVSDGNMMILRSNLHGGENAVHCGEHATTCTVQDSWLHGQYLPPDQPWHLGGFQSNGGTNVLLVHNYVVCDHAQNALGEGCTGDINLIPDFAVVAHMTVDHNLLGANIDASYCFYGGEKSTSPYPHANHVAFTNNVFERGSNGKCGAYGPVTAFDGAGEGNVWSGNTWKDDGSVVAPEN